MTLGGSRNACKVRAIRTDNPEQIIIYDSLQQAKKDASEWAGKAIHHQTVKRWADANKVMYGYKWENVIEDDEEDTSEVADLPLENVFTFRECVESIFNGGRVRVTNEIPRRVSVFDVIRIIIGDDTNPRMPWERLCKTLPEVVTRCDRVSFSGTGQRPTPVTDAQGVLLIVNALPGQRARQFRMGAMDVLTRYLAGDQTLHDEINENAARQATQPDDHPMQVFTDAIYANPKSSKYVLRSPLMKGRYIIEFYDKPVVYLLEFIWNSRKYIKVGWSMDFKDRITTHFKELPGCTIYAISIIDNPVTVEKKWKEALAAYNEELDVNGSNKTELFTGVSIEEAEQLLIRLCDDQRLRQAQEKQLDNIKDGICLERERMEHERAKMAHELEMKRLELQLMQGNISTSTSRATPLKRTRTTQQQDDGTTMDAMEIDNNTETQPAEETIPMLDNPSSLRGAYDRWLEVKEYFLNNTKPPWKKQYGAMAATHKLRFSRMRPFFNYIDLNADTHETADVIIDKLEMIRRKHRVAASVFIKSSFYDLYHLVSPTTKSPIPRQELLQELRTHNLPLPSIM